MANLLQLLNKAFGNDEPAPHTEDSGATNSPPEPPVEVPAGGDSPGSSAESQTPVPPSVKSLAGGGAPPAVTPPALSIEDVRGMDRAAINARWDEVSKVLKE